MGHLFTIRGNLIPAISGITHSELSWTCLTPSVCRLKAFRLIYLLKGALPRYSFATNKHPVVPVSQRVDVRASQFSNQILELIV